MLRYVMMVMVVSMLTLGCQKAEEATLEGCSNDNDCKGERICVDTECRDPEPKESGPQSQDTEEGERQTDQENATAIHKADPAQDSAQDSEEPAETEGTELNLDGDQPVVTVDFTNKALKEQDYQDYLFFDVTLVLSGTERSTRAIKGFIEFTDLFDEEQLSIGFTINDPLVPGEPLVKNGQGVKYNQFKDGIVWLARTDLKDIKIRYVITDIIYDDESGLPEDLDHIDASTESTPESGAELTLGERTADGFCEGIDEVLEYRSRRIRSCYERQLIAIPDLSGTVTIEWTINTDGSVKKYEITGATLENSKVEKCIGRVVGKLEFPSSSGICIVSQEFHLSSVGN